MSGFKKFQRILIIFLLVVSAFYGGYYYGSSGYIFKVRRDPPQVKILNRAPSNSEVDFSRFWEVWDLLSSSYLERPVDPQKMLWGSIEGMVNSLGDPYTSFLPPKVNEVVTNSINGTYYGIGAELGIKEGKLIVVAPLEGSPAKAAGVKAGDEILEIAGESALGITVTEAVSKIRGDAGTTISLLLRRSNAEPVTVHIQRGAINVPSITWEDKGEGTAYIRVSRFGADTNADWSKIASEVNVQMDELDAIILDLRGNPGGYMESAVYIAGEFLKKGSIVLYQESALGEQIPFETNRLGSFERIPVVFILVDEGSASASEILAAALRSHLESQIIGMKSFGKGTIQDAKDFSDGSGIHITIAKWLTPDKEWIHGTGLAPDIEVKLTQEDLENKFDAQLEKAVELAKEI